MIVLAVVTLVSCAPRGETITLDEVLAKAERRYSELVVAAKVSPAAQPLFAAVTSQVKEVASKLPRNSQKLAQEIDAAGLKDMGDDLAKIILHAGYTNRPALTEIAGQYRALSALPSVDPAQLKLLVARTYSILAAELETTQFSVS